MRREAVAELIRIILEIVGEESILIREVRGENENAGLIIVIGAEAPPDK